MFTVRVAVKRVEAQDVCSFELVEPSGGSLPPFGAGSHIDVELSQGLVRQYSLCNDSQESHRYVIAVLREPNSRGGSLALHERVKQGDQLRISEPRNHFALAHGANRSLLFAGGIGITPILCMAERLCNGGSPFQLHYCARTRQKMAFHDRIRTSKFAASTFFHFDDGPEEQKLTLGSILRSPSPADHLYVCGPAGFMAAVIAAAREHGWPEAAIHREYFTATPVKAAHEVAFEVRIASTGATIPVAPDQTVLAALAAHGIDIPYSCEEGVCGTCLTRVLEGVPDHRDHYLTETEKAANDQFLPCCSRAKSRLLLLDL